MHSSTLCCIDNQNHYHAIIVIRSIQATTFTEKEKNRYRKEVALRSVLLGSVLTNGVGTNFGVGVGEARPEGRERGCCSCGGAASPSPPAMGLRERCKLLQEPRPPKGVLYSVSSDCLSQHLGTCCI